MCKGGSVYSLHLWLQQRPSSPYGFTGAALRVLGVPEAGDGEAVTRPAAPEKLNNEPPDVQAASPPKGRYCGDNDDALVVVDDVDTPSTVGVDKDAGAHAVAAAADAAAPLLSSSSPKRRCVLVVKPVNRVCGGDAIATVLPNITTPSLLLWLCLPLQSDQLCMTPTHTASWGGVRVALALSWVWFAP